MAKFKIINNEYKKVVKVKLMRGEIIDKNELHILTGCSADGLIIPTLTNKRNLLYIVSGHVTLAQYIGQQMSRKRFLDLLMQTVYVTKKLSAENFDINKLTLDHNFVFFNEATKRLAFIYQPIYGNYKHNDIFAFFAYMLSVVNLFREENRYFINVISDFINSQRSYSSDEFEKCLLRIEPELSNESHGNQKNNYNIENENWKTTMLEEEGKTSILSGTSLLDKDNPYNESPFNENNVRAHLIRLSTQERIEIDKPVFRIGKERSYVDCFVNNNNAVSRIHADIITDGETFYIKDNNSTNGTFVNGKEIKAGNRMKIYDEDSIMLANERFTFHVEKGK